MEIIETKVNIGIDIKINFHHQNHIISTSMSE